MLGNSDVSGRICRSSGSAQEWTVPVSGVGVGPRSVETPWKVGEEDGQLAPLQAISSLVTRLLRSAQEGWLVDEKAPSGGSRVHYQPCHRGLARKEATR